MNAGIKIHTIKEILSYDMHSFESNMRNQASKRATRPGLARLIILVGPDGLHENFFWARPGKYLSRAARQEIEHYFFSRSTKRCHLLT